MATKPRRTAHNGGSNTDPLRKVVASGLYPYKPGGERLPSDLLECGHRLAAASDIFGNRSPSRRRCCHCATGQPQHFDPVQFDDPSNIGKLGT